MRIVLVTPETKILDPDRESISAVLSHVEYDHNAGVLYLILGPVQSPRIGNTPYNTLQVMPKFGDTFAALQECVSDKHSVSDGEELRLPGMDAVEGFRGY